MEVIYKPSGRAAEYAALAANLYTGCPHGCRYCFAPAVLHRTPRAFHDVVEPKRDAIERFERDLKKLPDDGAEVLLSFACDPYPQAEIEHRITRKAIQLMIACDRPFTVLTKAGTRAVRDFDLLASYPKASFGTTLVFLNQGMADYWEPGAASIMNRISAIREAAALGIRTWVSLEPVIDPSQALMIASLLDKLVSHWKVGKINYHANIADKVDWVAFRESISDIFTRNNADFYIKESLRSSAPETAAPLKGAPRVPAHPQATKRPHHMPRRAAPLKRAFPH